MINFALKDDDVYEEAGQIVMVTDGDEVAQSVKNRMATFLGEFFYNQNFGIPYWQVLQDTQTVEALNMSLKRTIESTVGVTKIVSFNSSVDEIKRHYSVEVIINTQYNNETTISRTYGYGL